MPLDLGHATAYHRCVASLVLLALVAGAAPTGTLNADASLVLQQGRALYSGVRAVVISTQYSAAYNYFNGVTYGVPYTPYNSIGDYMTVRAQPGDAEFRGLMRFEGIGERVPQGAQITEATLVLQATTYTRVPCTLRGAYLNRSWEWSQLKRLNGDPYKTVGWRYAAPNVSWTAPGALNDTIPGKSFAMEFLQVGATIREAPLDPLVVQTWLTESTNFGVLLHITAGPNQGNESTNVLLTSITTNNTDLLPYTPMLIIKYRPFASIEGQTLPVVANSTTQGAPIVVPSSKAINRTIYVDASLGDDRANGHALLPVKSLRVGVSIARSGDVILLRDGVYGGSPIEIPDLTIMSAPGHWAVISGPLYNPSQYVTLYIRDTAHRFHLARVEVTGGYYNAIGTHTTWEYYADGPLRETYGSAAEDVLIEDCRLHSAGNSVVKLAIAVKNATIRRNVIYGAGRRAAVSGHAIEAVNIRGGSIVDNYMFELPGAGVKMSGGCKDVLVARNTIERAHLAGILLGFYEQTEYMDRISNPQWYECKRCKAIANIVFNIYGTGIGLYASLDSFVAHNTLYSVAHTQMSAIVLSSVQHWVNASANGSPITGNANARIHNNIVVKGARSRPGNMMLQIREATSYVDGSKVGALQPNTLFNSSFNLYHTLAEPTPTTFVWGRGVMLEDERVASAFVGNLSMWQRRHDGWEVGSIDTNPALSDTFAPTGCVSLAVPPVANPPLPLLDFDGHPIVPDAHGRVSIGARQLAAAPTASSGVFPPLKAVALERDGYTGPGMYQGHFVIWPFREIEQHVPRTFVVAPSGVDNDVTHNASYERPFKKPSYAMSRMWPGDTLLLRGGVYTDPLRIYHPNITIASYPNETAVINVSNSDPSIANAVLFAGNDNGNLGGSGEVVLRGLEIIGGYYYGIMFNQAGGGTSNSYWNWWKAEHKLVTPSITLVEDCIVHNAGSHLIKVSPEANDIVFRRLRLYRSGKRGEVPPPPPANPQAAGSNEETPPTAQPTESVQGNGFDVRGGHRLTIEDCEIFDISGSAVVLGGGSADSVVQRNLIYNVAGIGILVGSYNTEATYMRLVENPRLFQAQRATVRNNIVFNTSGAGLGLYSTQGTVAVHNTFSNVAKSMHAALLFNIAPNFIHPATEVLPDNQDTIVLNNIFHQSVDAVGYMLENRIWTATTPATIDPPSYPGEVTCAAILATAAAAAQNQADPSIGAVSKTSGEGGGCPVLPPSHALNTRIDTYDVHPLSSEVMLRIQTPGCRCLGGDLKNCFKAAGSPSCGFLHPDFGGINAAENNEPVLSGFAVTYVNASVPRQMIPFNLYGDESDNVPFPLPANARVENTPQGCPMDVCSGDRHVIAVDTETCMLYETWKSAYNGSHWHAANGAVFNLTSNALRPLGWTSADAAGLPIYPALVRYDEVVRGEIKHAIRVTFANTRKAYVLPATHYAAPLNNEYLPAMGHRFRLKKSFNCTALARSARIVCVALQRYGAIVADNGANWFLSGEAHPLWAVNELADVKRIPASEMELVFTGDECTRPDCRPTPTSPVYPTVSAYRDLSTLYMDGNVYFKDAGDYRTSPVEFVDRDPVHFWRSVLQQDLSPWRNHTNGGEANGRIADPKLLAGFRLGPQSAALYAAPLASTFAGDTDFLGRPRRVDANFFVDAGALSYVANDVSADPRAHPMLPRDPLGLFVDPCAAAVPSAIVFVAVNGSDASCTGSATAPFATLRIAVRRVAEGGQVLLYRGTHQGGVVIGRNGITVESADPTRMARIHSTPLAGTDTITIAGDNASLLNLEIIGGFTATVSISGRFATVRDCWLHGAGTSIVLVQRSASGTVIETSILRNSGQRVPRLGHGVLVEGAWWVRIANNTFRSIRSTAVHVRQGALQVEVTHNVIVNAQRGISIGNDNANNDGSLPDFDDYSPVVDNACDWGAPENPDCYAALHTVVVGNIVQNTESFGIGLAGTYNVSVLHNTLRRCANSQYAPLYCTAVQHYITANRSPMRSNDRATIQNNIVTVRYEAYRPMVYLRKATNWGAVATTVGGLNLTTSTLDHNIYWKETAATAAVPALPYPRLFFTRHRGASATRDAMYFYDDAIAATPSMTFAAWQTAHGNAVDGNSLAMDPKFDPAAVAPCIASDSPAIAAAVSVGNLHVSVDMFSSPLVDIGAIQRASNDAAIRTIAQRVPLHVLNATTMAPPQSCIPAEAPLKQCDGVDCWHPWLSTPAPLAISMPRMLQTCLNGGAMFPPGHGMNRDIRFDRTHPLSDAYKTTIQANRLHPDWGTVYNGLPMGIPFMTVLGSKFNRTKVQFRYASESDAGPYIVPANSPVEGGDCDVNGDRHILVLDAETCKVYELFKIVYVDPEYTPWLGVGMSADSGVVFDMRSTQYRPLGFTSADAAGLSVFAGLVYKEEIDAGAIHHAIRYTVMQSQKAYVFPTATHFASTNPRADLPPMGLRARLKAWFNCTQYNSRDFTVICSAMKKHGLILADNGGNWFVTGSSDARWDDNLIQAMYNIPASALDIVDSGEALCTTTDCK